MATKVEDDFLYPIPIASSATDASITDGSGLRLTNALEAVYSLYQHAGAIPKQRFNPKEQQQQQKDGGGGGDQQQPSSSSAAVKVTKMDPAVKAPWFKYHDRVIPGGVMKLVESILIPTPKGWTTVTAARVNQLFDRRYLIEFESKEVLSQFTYTELDELRFAYAAVLDLITGGQEVVAKTQVSVAVASSSGLASASAGAPPLTSIASSSSSAASASAAPTAPPSFYAAQMLQAAINSKVFESMWGLQGLAKRDIKKNCEGGGAGGGEADGGPSSSGGGGGAQSSATANPSVVVAGKQKVGVAKGGTGSSGLVRTDASKERPKLSAEKKHAKALLEDECVKLWPHTPASKAAVFTLSNDPAQPRHKPLYQAVVELTMMNKRKVEGPWMGNKKDAEDGAAEVVLKLLYTASFGKKK